jgi:hypothetical protein
MGSGGGLEHVWCGWCQGLGFREEEEEEKKKMLQK